MSTHNIPFSLYKKITLNFFSKSAAMGFFPRVGWLVVLLFYVHGKHLRSCRDGQLT